MWIYVKELPYPVDLHTSDPWLARMILRFCKSLDGPWAVTMRYLAQRSLMPIQEAKTLLTDLATETLSHGEMLCAAAYQMTCCLTQEQKEAFALHAQWEGFGGLHSPAQVIPFPEDDPLACLYTDLATAQNTVRAYESLFLLNEEAEVRGLIAFLHQRALVHIKRLWEVLLLVRQKSEQDVDAKKNTEKDVPYTKDN